MSKYEDIIKHLKNNKYRWLITGAAGFIGSNIVEKLLDCDQDIVGIDNLSSGKIKNIEYLINLNKISKSGSFDFFEADICDYLVCKRHSENMDFVLHQAARGSVIKSIQDPLKTNNSNVSGFLNILHASVESKVNKFVFASSSSVYGDSKDLPKEEKTIGNQLSPYAVSKYINELYAKNFSDLYDLDIVGLRYFNVFGKNQDPFGEYAAVIPKWLDAIINFKNIEIFGDGKTSRDFCYIDNVVQANILSAFVKLNKRYEVFNVALNEKISLEELIQLIKNALLLNNFKRVNENKVIYKDFRIGDIRHSLADISKAREILSYEPEFKIEEGLYNYVKWYLSNN